MNLAEPWAQGNPRAGGYVSFRSGCAVLVGTAKNSRPRADHQRSGRRGERGAYGRGMHDRGRLLSGAMVGALTAPIPTLIGVGILRLEHVGCDFVAESGGAGEWMCPDGIGYAVPTLALWASFALLIFWVRIGAIARRTPEARSMMARDLALWGAVPMAVGGAIGAGFTLSGTGTGLDNPTLADVWTAAAQSLGVAVAAGLVVWTSRRGGSRLAFWCFAAAAAGAASLVRAALIAPLLVACIGILLPAALLSLSATTGDRALVDDAAA